MDFEGTAGAIEFFFVPRARLRAFVKVPLPRALRAAVGLSFSLVLFVFLLLRQSVSASRSSGRVLLFRGSSLLIHVGLPVTLLTSYTLP